MSSKRQIGIESLVFPSQSHSWGDRPYSLSSFCYKKGMVLAIVHEVCVLSQEAELPGKTGGQRI